MTSTFAEYVLFQFEVCLEDLSTQFRVPTVSNTNVTGPAARSSF